MTSPRPRLLDGQGQPAQVDDEDMNLEWADLLMKYNIALIGTPDSISEHLQRLQEEIGFQHLQMFPSIPFLTFEQAMSSLELIGTHVVPRFQKKS